jgi:hypothetical protein
MGKGVGYVGKQTVGVEKEMGKILDIRISLAISRNSGLPSEQIIKCLVAKLTESERYSAKMFKMESIKSPIIRTSQQRSHCSCATQLGVDYN